MPRRSARHDDDAPRVQELILIVVDAVKHHLLASLHHAPAYAVEQRVGLLENLLEHEVGIAPFFELRDGEFEFLDVDGRLLVLEVEYFQRFAFTDEGYLLIFEIDDVFGVLNERSGVGGEERFVVANSDDQRALLAGGHDGIGVILGDDGYGVGADNLLKGFAHGLYEGTLVFVANPADELHQHFGVGLRMEAATVLFECLFEELVVLDGAVVHQCDVAVFAVMGVCVAVGGGAVSGPARMRYAEGAVRVLVLAEVDEIVDLSYGFENIDFSGAAESYTGAVIAAVFQAV